MIQKICTFWHFLLRIRCREVLSYVKEIENEIPDKEKRSIFGTNALMEKMAIAHDG